MLTSDQINILAKKVNFVKGLDSVIPAYQTNVASLHYDVFEDGQYYDEYLVIDYVGGAHSYRRCNGNSCSAIFEEIAKMLDNGYYAEEGDYNYVKSHGTKVF